MHTLILCVYEGESIAEAMKRRGHGRCKVEDGIVHTSVAYYWPEDLIQYARFAEAVSGDFEESVVITFKGREGKHGG